MKNVLFHYLHLHSVAGQFGVRGEMEFLEDARAVGADGLYA